jgi:hypothetical protein
MRRGNLIRLALVALLAFTLLPAPAIVRAASFNGRPLVLDSGGRLLSWVQPQERAYGTVVMLAWNALQTRFPNDSNGLRPYLTHSTFDPATLRGGVAPHNPAGLYAMLADSALLSYPYSGDRGILAVAQATLDYMLGHGLTAASGAWPGVPYASSEPGATTYGGGGGDGLGVIEPDKVGELGYAYARFYELTGDTRYRDAAIAWANVLARQVRAGDATRSPWPFRVDAMSGAAREEYTAHVLGPIMLFDALTRLGIGDMAAYGTARQTAWAWLMAYPIRTNTWTAYFEDVPIQSDPTANPNQYIPLQTARYLIEHQDLDPDWRAHVRQLLQYVQTTFAVDAGPEPGVQWGAFAISEQYVDMEKMGSHTARFAALNALWYEATGDASAKENAFRSFNWATYMTDPNGIVSTGVDGRPGWWFSDGYGDYLRHFMLGMGAVPEWSPPGESHLLRSSALVRQVTYAPGGVQYQTTSADATEVLRLTSAPLGVQVGGVPIAQRGDLSSEGFTVQPLPGGDVVVRVHHVTSNSVTISMSSGTPGPTPMPTNSPPPPGSCSSTVGPGIQPPASVPAGLPGLHAAWYGQSGYPTLCAGQSSTATVAFYNAGSVGWVSGRMGEVAYLGTWAPEPGQDRPSPLGGDGQLGSPNTGWPRYNRIAIQPADYVGPGQIAWFQFTIRAPATAGTYRLYLRPVVEGAAWLEDFGVYWLVTVP